MTDSRNMILAIVLSALVLFGWSFVTETYFPTANPPATKIVDGKQIALPKPRADPAADAAAAIRDRGTVLAETRAQRITIATPALQGSINAKGARIDDLVLTRHRQDLTRNSPPVRLLSPSGGPEAYFATFGWTGEGLRLPDANTDWQRSGDRLSPDAPVTLRWDNGQGQVFTIRFAVDANYMFAVNQEVSNRGAGAVAVRPFASISRATASKDPTSWTQHVGPVGVFNGAANYDVGFESLAEDGDQRFATTGGWLGFTDKYWLAALIPDQATPVEAAFRRGARGGFQADIAASPTVIAPGQSSNTTTRFFGGAKEVALLDDYEDQLGIAQFDRAVDWGWFYWFMKPIFYLLAWLFSVIGNFGLAIIGLTFIVRLLVFPIAQKQFKSMAAVRVLQPKMQALQERHKEDKPRLQQEMLKLYQEEKVNPLSGCLPILLQIPIWYALYKVLLLAVEMRHKPFALWIKDLSAPDPLTPINLFGFLPFTPPAVIAVGVLPIIVGVTMWLQMRLNPAPMDAVQKQVFGIMPWVLMVVMAPFAAGLQLYWATGNILTILQQKYLYSRYPGLSTTPEPKPEAK